LDQPLAGWHGHAAPFSFEQGYRAHPTIDRLLVGTASQLAVISLEAALAAFDGVSMLDVRKKSESLTGLFIAQFDAQLAQFGFELVTPRDAARRGSQVSFTHPDGYAIMQAVIARGVIGDFRAPNILRFGFAPLYLSHRDIVNAIAISADVMHSGEWKRTEFSQKKAVT